MTPDVYTVNDLVFSPDRAQHLLDSRPREADLLTLLASALTAVIELHEKMADHPYPEENPHA